MTRYLQGNQIRAMSKSCLLAIAPYAPTGNGSLLVTTHTTPSRLGRVSCAFKRARSNYGQSAHL
eukprot:2441602-Rhodomonas_salina.1